MEKEKSLNKKPKNAVAEKKLAKSVEEKNEKKLAKSAEDKIEKNLSKSVEDKSDKKTSKSKSNKVSLSDNTDDTNFVNITPDTTPDQKDIEVPVLDAPTISPEFKLEEESKPNIWVNFAVFWKRLFSKKTKPEIVASESEAEIKSTDKKFYDEKHRGGKFANFWMILAIILITAIVTLLATVITQSIIDNKSNKKETERQATIYNIGDKEVPSFKYYTDSSAPVLIIDQKTSSTQEVRYRFVYSSLEELNSDKAKYITELKNYNFTLIVENDEEDESSGEEELIRYYDGTFIKVSFETKTTGDNFTLTVKYNRTI